MIFLALKYLVERKRQSILTLMGVFFGTVAYVSVSGFFLGFQGFMVEQLVNNSAMIHIQAREDYLEEHELDQGFYGNIFSHVFWRAPPARAVGYLEVQDPQGWYSRLSADPRVIAFSPIITTPVLYKLGPITWSASLIGCDPVEEAKVINIAYFMEEGSFSDIAAGGNRLILGDEIMKRLGAGMNQIVQVSSGGGTSMPFQVIGHFSTGNRGMDLQSYGNLNDAQRINGTPNRVTEISVKINDYTQAHAMAKNWSKSAPELIESWDMQNQNILSVFAIQTALRFLMIAAILVVAGFGIYNVLNMTVTQKRQDIAILRSMGYDGFDVVMLFFSQGLIVGICGAFFGMIVGYLVCRYLQTLSFMHVSPTNPTGHLHILLSTSIYIQAFFMAIFSASVASILPARAAGKLTPIDIIREGG